MSSRGNLSAETMLVHAEATNSIICEKWVQTGVLPAFSADGAAQNTGELQFKDVGSSVPALAVQTATLPGTPVWKKTANFANW